MRDTAQATDLLSWYDQHARALPWRVPPAESRAGHRPDPYHIWMSEVMLQQTTVAAVKEYFTRFTTLWPTVQDLAAADDARVMGEWAGLGYYARARNLLKCARVVVAEHDGQFPDTREALLKLPGIGPYTAAAISSIAFNRAETVVDGNVERVMARLFDIHTPLPAAKPELTEKAALMTPGDRPGDYAQAVMDLGATICTPARPPAASAPGSRPAPPAPPAPRPNCRRRPRRNPSPPGLASPTSRAAPMAPSCWKPAPTRGFWAACWAGPAPTGPRKCRITAPGGGGLARPGRRGPAPPSPISTCAWQSAWPTCPGAATPNAGSSCRRSSSALGSAHRDAKGV